MDEEDKLELLELLKKLNTTKYTFHTIPYKYREYDQVIEWIKEKKREQLLDILECIENPQHKHYSSPKRYIKSLINKS